MKVNIYTIGKKTLIGTYNVKYVYDSSFYFRGMPTLSAKRCREILNIVSPNFKIESETLVIENVETGHTGIQKIHRGGTILNF
ncbi:hypothetical protein SAMN05443270_3055 [Lacrimispora sphenoides]|uniref:hypothetical protein n=1 Tax=Lacrimispora sphenoides TaxID=29370 RepID=UPI0008C72307|nr:hypothetical protein [Lacrimispora sphenoides]SEU08960.1 hypothetical protein SAMN05443270_3055 [Lacrimispora sphenoides]